MKKLAKTGSIVLVVAIALFAIGAGVYFVILNVKWNSCKKDLASSFSYAQQHDGIVATYQSQTIKIEKNFELTNIYRELTTGSATGFQKKAASDDTITLQFGDGSELTASRLDGEQIQFYYCADGSAYGFVLSDSSSFKNLCAFVLRNA